MAPFLTGVEKTKLKPWSKKHHRRYMGYLGLPSYLLPACGMKCLK